MNLDWSPWRRLQPELPLSPATLAELIDGGQAFRWYAGPEGIWTGAWSDHLVRLTLDAEGFLLWSALRANEHATGPALARYLGLDAPFSSRVDALPWRSDPHLATTLRTFPGLRILRQPFDEALLGFLCSATKQIVQIKQMLALLAERHGTPLIAGGMHPPFPGGLHRLPTWEQLAEVPEATLRACLLGFRARYIHATAQFLAERPGWLAETEQLPYADARARLVSLPGVGEKVADCVLLFGAGRLEAFPVDVWMIKTMARRYGLDGWNASQIAHFGRVHFGSCAGLAQQYLFAWERRVGRGERT